GLLLRLRLPRPAGVPGPAARGRSGWRAGACDAGGGAADAGAGPGERGHWRAGRRRRSQGPDRERARVAPGLAAGSLVPAARVAVETARRGARVRAGAAAALRQEAGARRQEGAGPLGPIPVGAASAATRQTHGRQVTVSVRLQGRG